MTFCLISYDRSKFENIQAAKFMFNRMIVLKKESRSAIELMQTNFLILLYFKEIITTLFPDFRAIIINRKAWIIRVSCPPDHE